MLSAYIFFVGFYTSFFYLFSYLFYKTVSKVFFKKSKKIRNIIKKEIINNQDVNKINNDKNTKVSSPIKIPTRKIEEEIDQEKYKEIKIILTKIDFLMSKGEDEEIEKMLIKILSIDEDHYEANARLGFVYLKNSKYKKAENILRKAVNNDICNDPSVFTNFALSMLKQEDEKLIGESIIMLEKAKTIDNKNPERYITLGHYLFFNNKKKESLEYFISAVNLDPKNQDYLFLLADNYLALNEKGKAKEILKKILNISPFNEEAKKELMILEEG